MCKPRQGDWPKVMCQLFLAEQKWHLCGSRLALHTFAFPEGHLPGTAITLWRRHPGRCLSLGVHRSSFPVELCRSPFRYTLGFLIIEMKTLRLIKSLI